MFGFGGPWELVIIAVIVLLLFGKRLPGVMGSLGKSIVEFKKGIKGIQEDIDSAESTTQTSSSDSEPASKETVPPE